MTDDESKGSDYNVVVVPASTVKNLNSRKLYYTTAFSQKRAMFSHNALDANLDSHSVELTILVVTGYREEKSITCKSTLLNQKRFEVVI